MTKETKNKTWIPITAAIITGACGVIAAIVTLGSPFAERLAENYFQSTPIPNTENVNSTDIPEINNTDSISGYWEGSVVDEGTGNRVDVQIEIERNCDVTKVCGKLTLPEFPCYANLKLLSIRNGIFTFEEIDASGEDFCTSGGRETLQLLADGTVLRKFQSTDGTISSQGILETP